MAGWPSTVTSDPGLHNFGVFSTTLQANGVRIRIAGLEAPSQLGRGDRHGGIFNDHLNHIVKVHKVIGKKGMKMGDLRCNQMQEPNDEERRHRTLPKGS